MADINHVILIGRLTRNAELKFTTNGTAVSKFSIAVNRSVKRGDNWESEANYFDIVLWGKQAESLNDYLLKGKQIAVDGELRQDRWQQDGQNRSKVEVIASTIKLLGGGSDSRQSGSGYSNGNETGYSGNSGRGQGQKPSQGHTRENDDDFKNDIPF
jgi:single-strand DNA-binding protein